MPFRHDSTGIKPNTFEPMPEEDFFFAITDAKEGKSKEKSYDMVEVELTCIENEQYHGRRIKHYVVFIPKGEKGDWMNVHFRKCIGVPHGGDDVVNASEWIGKKIRAKLKIETREWEGKTYTNNKVDKVSPYGTDFPAVTVNDEIPF
jgi:hypothetical protein